MKLLAEISDNTLGIGEAEVLGSEYQLRKSGRVVLINDEGLIAMQHLRAHHFHKLPGGGVERGEAPEEATIRETLEEVGCDCTITALLGVVIEYRNKYNLLHISYGFAAKVSGPIGAPTYETGELEAGQETVWLSPADALLKLQTDTPTTYEGKFILPRERAFLETFLASQD